MHDAYQVKQQRSYYTYTSRYGIVSPSPGGLGDDDGDCDCVCGVQAYGLGGQDGYHVPANVRWGGGAIHRHCSRPDLQINGRVCVLGRCYQPKSGSQCRGNASNPEGMGVLRAVYDGNL